MRDRYEAATVVFSSVLPAQDPDPDDHDVRPAVPKVATDT
jgi:hypothetical protein